MQHFSVERYTVNLLITCVFNDANDFEIKIKEEDNIYNSVTWTK